MGTFSKTLISGVALLAAAGPALSAHTGDHASRLSWFNDAPFAGAGPVGVPEARLMKPSDYSTFGVRLHAAEEAYAVNVPAPVADISAFRLYGEVESPRAGNGSIAALQDVSPGRVNVFGVSWQHRLNAMNTLALSAEYGESTVMTPGMAENAMGAVVSPLAAETFDTRAAFSWTSHLPLAASPSITGSVYLGDAMAREENFRYLGRRYYGFTVGGSLTLFQSHTPYVSFKMQRSLYEPVATDPLMTTTTTTVAPRSGDRSLLSAGWKWQAGRDFSLQAEASYGLGETPGTSLDPYSLERSRILFGTRFGFK